MATKNAIPYHTMPYTFNKMSCIKWIILEYTRYSTYCPIHMHQQIFNKIEIICLFVCVHFFFFFKMQIIHCIWNAQSLKKKIITIDMKLINSWFEMYTSLHCDYEYFIGWHSFILPKPHTYAYIYNIHAVQIQE